MGNVYQDYIFDVIQRHHSMTSNIKQRSWKERTGETDNTFTQSVISEWDYQAQRRVAEGVSKDPMVGAQIHVCFNVSISLKGFAYYRKTRAILTQY